MGKVKTCGCDFHSTSSYCVRMSYFKNILVGVLAGDLRHVLNGIGGYWWVLGGIGNHRLSRSGILKIMAKKEKCNIIQGFIAKSAYNLKLRT